MYGFDPQQNPGIDPQELLNRQSAADPTQELESGARSLRSSVGNSLQNQQNNYQALQTEMIRQQQQQQVQQPGGVRRFIAGMLYGAGSAALKESTGETPAETEFKRAQTFATLQDAELKKQQFERMMTPVEIPDPSDPTGQNKITLPAFIAEKAYAPTIAGQYRVQAVKEGNEGKRDVAIITADNKLAVEQMKSKMLSGQVSRAIPVTDEQTGQPVMRMLNKFGQPIGDIDNAIFPQLLPKTSTGVAFKQQEDGSWVSIPKTTTTQPVLPGRGSAPSGGGAGGAKVVSGPDGQPLITPTSTTRTMIEAAPKVQQFIQAIKSDMQDQSLGPAMSRWREFWAGKIGESDPAFTKLRTDVGLLQTLLMRMHVGARGGEYIMKHFQDLIDSGKQDPQNLNAAMDAIDRYAGSLIHKRGGESGGQPKATHRFNPATGRIEAIP